MGKLWFEDERLRLDNGNRAKAFAPAVIAASRVTDIPAHYCDWFFHRLRQGYVAVPPFGSTKKMHRYVSFANTQFIVFFSKNPRPLIGHLPYLKEKNIDFYINYTLNDYSRLGFEPGLNIEAPLEMRIDTFKRLADKVGPERVVWHFDPLILAPKIRIDTLMERISFIAEQLKGYTQRLVFGFLNVPKDSIVQSNLKARELPFKPWSTGMKNVIVKEIVKANRQWGFQLSTCSNNEDYRAQGVRQGRCVDYELITRLSWRNNFLMDTIGAKIYTYDPQPSLFGDVDPLPEEAIMLDSNHYILRGEEYKKSVSAIAGENQCQCHYSFDIGMRGTCTYKCAYCFAADHSYKLDSYIQGHNSNPKAPSLTGEQDHELTLAVEKKIQPKGIQLDRSLKTPTGVRSDYDQAAILPENDPYYRLAKRLLPNADIITIQDIERIKSHYPDPYFILGEAEDSPSDSSEDSEFVDEEKSSLDINQGTSEERTDDIKDKDEEEAESSPSKSETVTSSNASDISNLTEDIKPQTPVDDDKKVDTDLEISNDISDLVEDIKPQTPIDIDRKADTDLEISSESLSNHEGQIEEGKVDLKESKQDNSEFIFFKNRQNLVEVSDDGEVIIDPDDEVDPFYDLIPQDERIKDERKKGQRKAVGRRPKRPHKESRKVSSSGTEKAKPVSSETKIEIDSSSLNDRVTLSEPTEPDSSAIKIEGDSSESQHPPKYVDDSPISTETEIETDTTPLSDEVTLSEPTEPDSPAIKIEGDSSDSLRPLKFVDNSPISTETELETSSSPLSDEVTLSEPTETSEPDSSDIKIEEDSSESLRPLKFEDESQISTETELETSSSLLSDGAILSEPSEPDSSDIKIDEDSSESLYPLKFVDDSPISTETELEARSSSLNDEVTISESTEPSELDSSAIKIEEDSSESLRPLKFEDDSPISGADFIDSSKPFNALEYLRMLKDSGHYQTEEEVLEAFVKKVNALVIGEPNEGVGGSMGSTGSVSELESTDIDYEEELEEDYDVVVNSVPLSGIVLSPCESDLESDAETELPEISDSSSDDTTIYIKDSQDNQFLKDIEYILDNESTQDSHISRVSSNRDISESITDYDLVKEVIRNSEVKERLSDAIAKTKEQQKKFDSENTDADYNHSLQHSDVLSPNTASSEDSEDSFDSDVLFGMHRTSLRNMMKKK